VVPPVDQPAVNGVSVSDATPAPRPVPQPRITTADQQARRETNGRENRVRFALEEEAS
jgi:hypothetical protein